MRSAKHSCPPGAQSQPNVGASLPWAAFSGGCWQVAAAPGRGEPGCFVGMTVLMLELLLWAWTVVFQVTTLLQGTCLPLPAPPPHCITAAHVPAVTEQAQTGAPGPGCTLGSPGPSCCGNGVHHTCWVYTSSSFVYYSVIILGAI